MSIATAAELAKMVFDLAKEVVTALNEMEEAWRQQEQAEADLANAAKNNPYLNDRNIRQLKAFADEMQRATGMGREQILQTETRLASLGKNQDQMQKIIKTAVEMAAAGIMPFDEAVDELNDSYSGVIRTSGGLYPELRKLSQEALASGEAIDIIAKKVEGSAAEAMKTGVGSFNAYSNAIGDLKIIIGQGWEEATLPARRWITEIINNFTAVRQARREMDGLLADQASMEINFEDLAPEQQKQLKRNVSYIESTFATAVRDGIDGEGMSAIEAVEAALRGLAGEDYNVELVRQAMLTSQKISEGLRNQLELLGNKTRAEMEYKVAVEAARKAEEAAVRAETQEALDAAAAAKAALKDVVQAMRDANFEGARSARERVEEYARIAEAEAQMAEKQLAGEEKISQFRNDYEEALKKREASILKQAELEGKSVDSMEVKKQLLDAQISAYKGLLDASEGLLTGELEYEQAVERTLKSLRERHEVEQWTDEQRKKNLSELAARQNELNNQLKKIYDDVKGEANRQGDLSSERNHQERLAEIRKTSVKEAIEYEANVEREKREMAVAEKTAELNDLRDKQLTALDELKEAELAKYREGHPAREAVEKEFLDKKEQINNDTDNAIATMELNLRDEILNINRQKNEALEEASKKLFKKRLDDVQQYLDVSQQIASGISTIWHNAIDYELNEALRRNDEIEQSDEERAAKEKELTMTAAAERYKADLFAWKSNMIMAVAQGAMAIMNALTTVTPWPAAIAAAAIAGTMSLIQQATILSAQPQPPRFHTGGVVQGRAGQEVPSVLMAGEVVSTQKQFSDTMKAMSSLAGMKSGSTVVQPQVKINNTISDQAQVDAGFDLEGLVIDITNKALSEGRLDQGLAVQHKNAGGVAFL
jgi:hypothetical protein